LYDLKRIPQIAASLDEMQNECLITLALKITDDTCKMDAYERSVFMTLYDALSDYQSTFFDSDVFDLIGRGRSEPTAQIFSAIKPIREAGMKYVTRPRMKAFKAAVRDQLQ
jgi:hypothetical protein